MKTRMLIAVILLAIHGVLAQGTFVFDQQSSTDESLPIYGQGGTIQDILSPWGQSFTPGLSSVGFIRLKLVDGNIDDGLGASVYLNLRSGSISGPVIGVTAPLLMASSFRGVAEFTFQSPILVTPGTTYYYEPVVSSGGPWNIVGNSAYFYSGGTGYENGRPVAYDQWFREGIVVPEPTSVSLGLLGLAVLAVWRRNSTYHSSMNGNTTMDPN